MERPPRSHGWTDVLGIPPILWQTCFSKELTGRAAVCRESWKRMNTQWDLRFLDDAEIDAMMASSFPGAAVETFRAFPLGVMRADMWRYAVLLEYGGLYADVDCTCHLPAHDWDFELPPGARHRENPWLVVGVENDEHFCNWTIAGGAGHPALRRVIDLIVERSREGIDYTNEHFVHEHTGPAIWTDAILDVLDMDGSPQKIFEDRELRDEALRKGILILDRPSFRHSFCENENASESFGDGWVSWKQQRDRMLNEDD